jgi:hypothetical protein
MRAHSVSAIFAGTGADGVPDGKPGDDEGAELVDRGEIETNGGESPCGGGSLLQATSRASPSPAATTATRRAAGLTSAAVRMARR